MCDDVCTVCNLYIHTISHISTNYIQFYTLYTIWKNHTATILPKFFQTWVQVLVHFGRVAREINKGLVQDTKRPFTMFTHPPLRVFSGRNMLLSSVPL